MDVTAWQWVVAIACGVLIGITKSGFSTLGILAAAIMAAVFPARESVGIMTPLLIAGDLIAIVYYRKAVVWRHLLVLFPWVAAGIGAGYYVLGEIDNHALSLLIGSLVLVLILLHLFKEKLEAALNFSFAKSAAWSGSLGVLAGFTTMIGNAAGSIMSIYLLSKGMNKTNFVGTNAFFFFIVNVFKVPFTTSLGLITGHTLLFNAWIVPAVAAGFAAGFMLLPHIPQKHFQTVILCLAAAGGVYLLFE